MASTISAGTTTTTALVQTADTSGVLQLQTNGSTTAVTIDTAQNVGIQTTPSAWSANRPAIELGGSVQGTIAFNGNNSNGGLITYNSYYNGSATVYKNTGYACNYIIGTSSGSHVWTVAPSGSAGASVSSTTAMTLDNGGNLKTAASLWAAGVGNAGGVYLGSSGSANGLISQASFGAATITTYIGNQAITTISDVRLKENVVNTTRNGLNLVNQLRVVDHTWNDPSDQCENNRNSRGIWMGLIAQEAQPVIPWLVNKPLEDVDKDGNPQYWHMDYGYSVPLLIKAIQELSAKVTALEAKVA